MQAQISSPWYNHSLSDSGIPQEHIWISISTPDQAMPAWSLLQTLARKSVLPVSPSSQDSI